MDQISHNAKANAIILHERDNVATALTDYPENSDIWFAERELRIELQQRIAFGHKFAISDIPAGGIVIKYGVPIGIAFRDIRSGEHVHMHNLRSMQKEGESDERVQKEGWSSRNT